MGCSFALIYVFVLFTSFLHPFLLMENNHEQTTFHINDCYWSATVSRRDWGWDAINRFSQPHVCACPKSGPGFPTSYVVVFLCSTSSIKIRGSLCWIDDHHCWEVIVRFVDIGGIDDHHCLSFLFIINNMCSIYL